MATKTVDGKALPASAFLVVEDPDKVSTWHLQVRDDEGKPDHALMAAAHAALLSPGGHRGNPYTGPDKDGAISKLKSLYKSECMDWPEDKAAMSQALSDALGDGDDAAPDAVVFSASTELDTAPLGATDDAVIRTAKLIDVADYPDKGMSFTNADLAATVASFQPVPMRLGHDFMLSRESRMPAPLRDKLGSLRRVFPSKDGKSLMGEVHLPKWLDALLDPASRKVSTEWNRQSKRLTALALVEEPRVSDAALMAAFSAAPEDALLAALFAAKRHDTPSGQLAMQRLHDIAAEAGAVCKRPVAMSSRHESTALQTVHDTAVDHGAQCSAMNGQFPSYALYSANPSRPSTTDRRSVMSRFTDWILGKAKEEGIDLDPAELTAAFSGDADTKVKALEQELAARDQKIASLEQATGDHTAAFARQLEEQRRSDAAAFARSAVDAHRVPAGAIEALTELAERVAAADGTVSFSEGEKNTTALLREFVNGLPDLGIFTTEKLDATKVAAFANQLNTDGVNGHKDPMSPERRQRLLKKTSLGRAVATKRATGAQS